MAVCKVSECGGGSWPRLVADEMFCDIFFEIHNLSKYAAYVYIWMNVFLVGYFRITTDSYITCKQTLTPKHYKILLIGGDSNSARWGVWGVWCVALNIIPWISVVVGWGPLLQERPFGPCSA